ncbi:uncharacterized protein LOC143919244 [Arctopsyche grandis]|uniref:uncharacterized protein LOC143919244 n=1 Tax=Arctopsyche grandis TaxID=121162 RepID=UPI00406D8DE5
MTSSISNDTKKSSEDLLSLSMELSFDERLIKFVHHFVVELESTLQLHYDILVGNINKSGQIPKFIGVALGLLANYYIHKGADKVVKLFQTTVAKPFEVIEKNKSLEYYDIVYNFHRSKANGRKVFADIAIDVFQSFEFQFACITSTRGDEKAIQRVARDAAQRFLNRLKSEGKSYSDNTIVRKLQKGWGKINKSCKPQLPAPKVGYEMNALRVVEGKSKSKCELIPDKWCKPGFDILFKCRKFPVECKNELKDWNTCDLFDSVRIAEKLIDPDGYNVYRYRIDKSNCERYGYRFPFPGEDVKDENKYISTEMCANICMHPQMFKSRDFYNKSQREILLKSINDNDQVAVQNRISQLTEEMKEDFNEFKNTLTKLNEDTSNTIEKFNTELKNIAEHYKNIQKDFKSAEEHRNTLAKEIEERQQADKEEIISSITDHITHVFKQNNAEMHKRVLFGVKNPTMSFEGRINELKLLHEALMNKTTAEISQAASIVGLGGIGKTELVKKYMKIHKEYYHNILFINAEKSETALKSFKTLANKIGIKLLLNDGKVRDMTDVVGDIYERLNKTGKTLIVFDNAEEYKDIKKYIFDKSYDDTNIYTLITSRCKKWDIGDKGDIKVIQLSIFTEDEAVNYLRRSLANEDEDDLKSLMSLLQRFPLGLKQAIGYIKQQNQHSNTRKHAKSFDVQDYIHLYEEKWKEVLQKGHGEVDDLYENTIATTWRVTMHKIEESGERGKLALSVLKIMAYLSPDDIDIEEIFSKLEQNIDRLNEAVDLLHDYSMINNEKGIVDVHRLVQKAIQIYLIEIEEEENVLNEALKLLDWCNFEEHTVSVWEHSCNYPDIVKKQLLQF